LEQVEKSVKLSTDIDYNRSYSEELIAYFAVYIPLSLVSANCSVTSLTLYDLRSQSKLVHFWEWIF
jgi:hypothetical protein